MTGSGYRHHLGSQERLGLTESAWVSNAVAEDLEKVGAGWDVKFDADVNRASSVLKSTDNDRHVQQAVRTVVTVTRVILRDAIALEVDRKVAVAVN